jgi:maltooligosyltrehalose trehalohydrolase
VERRLPPRAARALTGEGQGYYADFAEAGLGRAGQGADRRVLPRRRLVELPPRHHGRPVDTALLPGWKFVGYLQDHDQIGNRAGRRPDLGAPLSPACSPSAPRWC